jgi:hypothetical protein
MANLTITVAERTLRRARVRAVEQGTSVNAVLSAYLARYAGEHETQARAVQSLLALGEANSKGPARARARRRPGRGYTRDDLHER